MQLRHWGARLLLGVMLFGGVLACRTSDIFLAQAQPTATSTRILRPTFTPLPPPTNTPIPPPPTVPPPPTATQRPPTARPQPTATRRPPTQVPAPQPPPPPQPTAFPYEWHANPPRCEHSGMAFIKGAVYSDKNNPDSKTPGIRVAFGAADGTTIYGQVTTDDVGEYTFLLNANGPKPGTYYVWVIDGSGKRTSEIGGPIVMNSLGPDAPGTCWNGSVDFWK